MRHRSQPLRTVYSSADLEFAGRFHGDSLHSSRSAGQFRAKIFSGRQSLGNHVPDIAPSTGPVRKACGPVGAPPHSCSVVRRNWNLRHHFFRELFSDASSAPISNITKPWDSVAQTNIRRPWDPFERYTERFLIRPPWNPSDAYRIQPCDDRHGNIPYHARCVRRK